MTGYSNHAGGIKLVLHFKSEREFQWLYARFLESQGWQVQFEKKIKISNLDEKPRFLFIDILAFHGHTIRIIEAKQSVRTHKGASRAIAQLKEYEPYYPSSELWLAVSEPLDKELRECIEACGIQVYEPQNDFIQYATMHKVLAVGTADMPRRRVKEGRRPCC